MPACIPSNNLHLPCLQPGCPQWFKAQNTRTYHYCIVHQNNNAVNHHQSSQSPSDPVNLIPQGNDNNYSDPVNSIPQDNDDDNDDPPMNFDNKPQLQPSPLPSPSLPPSNPPPKPPSNHNFHPHLDGMLLSINFYSTLMVSQLDHATQKADFYLKAHPHRLSKTMQTAGHCTKTRFNSDALIFSTKRLRCLHLTSTTSWKCGHYQRLRAMI